MLFYILGALVIFLVLLKLYLWFTTGKYRIRENLSGKVVLITGPTAGIGKETAFALAKAGATVHLLCRNKVKGERVAKEIWHATENAKVFVHHVDMCSFASIKRFAEDYLKTEHKIHVLINNAGLLATKQNVTEDGCEETMQGNYFGHFLLTNLLLDRIKESAPSRIVNVSSIGHKFTKNIDVTDLNFEHTPYGPNTAYMWSKLCNILFTVELASRLRGTGVTTNALHPGGVKSELYAQQPPIYLWPFVLMAFPFMKTALEGAQTTLYVALSPKLSHVTGYYFSDCKPETSSLEAMDYNLASDLWKETERVLASKNYELK